MITIQKNGVPPTLPANNDKIAEHEPIIMEAELFQEIFAQVLEYNGEYTSQILFDSGFFIGQKIYRQLNNKGRLSPSDRLKLFIQGEENKKQGKYNLLEYNLEQKKVLCQVENSPFAKPISNFISGCELVRGKLAGFFTLLFKDEVECSQISCQVDGQNNKTKGCLFSIKGMGSKQEDIWTW